MLGASCQLTASLQGPGWQEGPVLRALMEGVECAGPALRPPGIPRCSWRNMAQGREQHGRSGRDGGGGGGTAPAKRSTELSKVPRAGLPRDWVAPKQELGPEQGPSKRWNPEVEAGQAWQWVSPQPCTSLAHKPLPSVRGVGGRGGVP